MFRITNNAAFTLLDLMIAIAIIGILSSVAVPVFVHFNAEAKSVEGKMNLESIGRGAAAFFSEEHAYENGLFVRSGEYPSRTNAYRKKYSTQVLPALGGMPYEGKSQHDGNSSLGKKHNPADFADHFKSYPWVDLGFRISTPFYFSYNYEGEVQGKGEKANSRFAASASACLARWCTTEWSCDYGYIIVGTPSGKISPLIDNSTFQLEHCGKARLKQIKKTVEFLDFY